jgi:hypothetical protein
MKIDEPRDLVDMSEKLPDDGKSRTGMESLYPARQSEVRDLPFRLTTEIDLSPWLVLVQVHAH